MRHKNSVFHDLLKHVSWSEFERLVTAHGADPGRNGVQDFRGEKRSNETHASTTDPDARLYRKGRGKEAKLCFMGHALMENRHALRLYHLGARPPRRSTLADANALRSAAVFADLFARLAGRAHRGLRRALAETT